MAQGAGKYDPQLVHALADAGAKCGVLMVLNGNHGSGFAVQATVQQLLHLPGILRSMADSIEADTVETEKKEPGWTQPICADCFQETYGGEPVRVSSPHPECCCLCGDDTSDGIYIRIDPRTVAFPRSE